MNTPQVLNYSICPSNHSCLALENDFYECSDENINVGGGEFDKVRMKRVFMTGGITGTLENAWSAIVELLEIACPTINLATILKKYDDKRITVIILSNGKVKVNSSVLANVFVEIRNVTHDYVDGYAIGVIWKYATKLFDDARQEIKEIVDGFDEEQWERMPDVFL